MTPQGIATASLMELLTEYLNACYEVNGCVWGGIKIKAGNYNHEKEEENVSTKDWC